MSRKEELKNLRLLLNQFQSELSAAVIAKLSTDLGLDEYYDFEIEDASLYFLEDRIRYLCISDANTIVDLLDHLNDKYGDHHPGKAKLLKEIIRFIG